MHIHHISHEQYKKSAKESLKIINGMKFIHHPLNTSIYFEGSELAGIPSPDEFIQHKYKELERAYRDKNTSSYVFIHARPYRLEALLDAQVWSNMEEWYKVAGQVWIDSENPGVNSKIWKLSVFNTPHTYLVMDEEELKAFRSIGSKGEPGIQVYRGGNSSYVTRGLSWTINRDKAIWFARRFRPADSYLASALVNRFHVAAVFHRRGEEELILKRLPRKVQIELLQNL